MIVFHAGPQATKVRILWIACLILFILAVACTVVLVSMGPDSSAQTGPPVGIGVIFSGLFLVAGAGMTLYAHCYIESLELSDDGARIVIATVGLRGERVRQFDFNDIQAARFSSGEMRTVKAPWWTLRMRDRDLPLILDAQGFIAEPEMLDAILAGRFPAGSKTPSSRTPRKRKRRR